MTLRRRRRALAALLLTLPALFLAGWLVVEQLPNWLSPVPVWLQPNNPAVVFGACEATASLRAYNGRFVSEAAAISPEAARASALEAASGLYSDIPTPEIVQQGPLLVRATFPGKGERLAWLNVAILEHDANARLGKVSILYSDAQTGDLLAAVTAISVTDAQSACSGPPISRRVLVRQYLPLLLLVAYLGAVLLSGLAVGLLRRRRAKTG